MEDLAIRAGSAQTLKRQVSIRKKTKESNHHNLTTSEYQVNKSINHKIQSKDGDVKSSLN